MVYSERFSICNTYENAREVFQKIKNNIVLLLKVVDDQTTQPPGTTPPPPPRWFEKN